MSTPTSKHPSLCVCVHACGNVYTDFSSLLGNLCAENVKQLLSGQPAVSRVQCPANWFLSGESLVGCGMAQCLMCCVVIFSLTMMCTHATPLRTCTHIFLFYWQIHPYNVTTPLRTCTHIFFIDRSIQCCCCTGKRCFICQLTTLNHYGVREQAVPCAWCKTLLLKLKQKWYWKRGGPFSGFHLRRHKYAWMYFLSQ